MVCTNPLNDRGSFHSSSWPPAEGSMRELKSREGLSLSLRKIEKAMKARMMKPPTVPPTMRMVFVWLPEVGVLVCASDVADVVRDDEVVEAEVCCVVVFCVVEGVGVLMVLVTVGTSVGLGVDDNVVGWAVGVATCCWVVVGRTGVNTLDEDVATGTTTGVVSVGVITACCEVVLCWVGPAFVMAVSTIGAGVV